MFLDILECSWIFYIALGTPKVFQYLLKWEFNFAFL